MNYQIYALDELHFFAQKACHYIPREALEDESIDESACNLVIAPQGAISWTGYEREDVDMFAKIVRSIINRHTKGEDPELKQAFMCCSGRQRQLGQILLARKLFLEELPTNSDIQEKDAVKSICGIWIPVETAFVDRTGGLRYRTESWVRI